MATRKEPKGCAEPASEGILSHIRAASGQLAAMASCYALALAWAGAGMLLGQAVALLLGLISLLRARCTVGVVLWLSRIVAARRLRAAVNTYAERALARERRRPPRRPWATHVN